MSPNQFYYKKGHPGNYGVNKAGGKSKNNVAAQQMVYQKKEEQLQAVAQPEQTAAAVAETAQDNGWQSLTVGTEGPVLAEDLWLHETLAEFASSKTPERVVFNKGYGAFGTFTVYQSMAPYTKACFLQTPGQKIDVFSRFSWEVSNKGTPDTSRNVRGFATKFYTQEGVYDLLCCHIPVAPVRDGIKYPAVIRAMSPSPISNLNCPAQYWQFVADNPEAVHFTMLLYSDLGTLDDVRCLRSYSVNTYVWENLCGQQRYVRYHWVPLGNMQTIDRETAMRLAGENPDIAGEKLYCALAQGNVVQFDLCVQLMELEQAEALSFYPLDSTKIWPEEQFPMMHVGRLTLDRNVSCYQDQVEASAFSPANLVEGIGLSNDRLLQAKAILAWDAQRHRLGPDFRRLAINRQNGWTPDRLTTNISIGDALDGTVQRCPITPASDFTQAGEYYQSLSAEQQANLIDNVASELVQASCPVQEQVLAYLQQVDCSFGQQVQQRISWYVEQKNCCSDRS